MNKTTGYSDKNGEQIKAGMKIRHINGDVELVYACGEDDLGVNASNENWSGFSEYLRQFYPLYQFNTREWEIVK